MNQLDEAAKEKLLLGVVARSYALRDIVAYLLSAEAINSQAPDAFFQNAAEALQARTR